MLTIVPGCQPSKDYGGDDDDDEEQQLVGTEQERMEMRDNEKESNRCERQGDLKRTREIESGEVESSLQANGIKTESSEVEQMHSTDKYKSNMTEFRIEIQEFKQQYYRDKLATKCHQIKIHRTKDEDVEETIRDFDNRETLPLLNKLELIKDQWRTMDLWGLLQQVNPSPEIYFDRGVILQDETFSQRESDITLRWSIVLCCIFEDLMRSVGLKVGDTLDIDENICRVVGKLILSVEEQDRSILLNCMQNAMVNIQTNGNEPGCDKLRSLLITKKKYNGSNLACILLEQMILDNKDNNVSWMRTVCSQFIDLVVPLIIEPEVSRKHTLDLELLDEVGITLVSCEYLRLYEKRHAVVPTPTGHLPSTLGKNSKLCCSTVIEFLSR